MTRCISSVCMHQSSAHLVGVNVLVATDDQRRSLWRNSIGGRTRRGIIRSASYLARRFGLLSRHDIGVR